MSVIWKFITDNGKYVWLEYVLNGRTTLKRFTHAGYEAFMLEHDEDYFLN